MPLKASFLALAALLVLGCDHPVTVRGKAYLKPVGTRSVVLMNRGTAPADLEPLKDVKITVYHSADDAHRAGYVPYKWNIAKTAAGGAFELEGTCGFTPREMA